MARVTVRPNGSSAFMPGGAPATAKRGKIVGWSRGASARNTQFLMSVITDELPHGYGYAITLTLGFTPETSDDWHKLRKAIIQVMRREGVELVHWVVEWTRLKRPHLHMAVYGDIGDLPLFVVTRWLKLADLRGWPVTFKGQHVVPITDALGWLQYVAKHAARGAGHYQREGAPEGWETTGKLWGTMGDWPQAEGVSYDLTDGQFWAYRREFYKYQRSKLRGLGLSRTKIQRIGKMARHPKRGRVAGVSGWIPEEVSNTLLVFAVSDTGTAGTYEWENT